ncbi:2-hydroxychromene-2-carboxylate isomerase [Leptothrix ochracea]|uniref:2-hydroxychromene-2-carboxylate isomerase n=1 Tax=Leptothrix ochracea TaxID=735331 RepID=UPI0034E2E8F6
MTPLRFCFDPLSPYAWLAFEALPEALAGLSHSVEYRPILLAPLLAHWGQLGPAEIEPKRLWLWRQVRWLAQGQGLAFRPPARHPFNPLGAARLLWACADEGETPSRWACETVLRQIWTSGEAADDPAVLQRWREQVQAQLRRDPAGDPVRQQLRRETEAAIERGLFGVPMIEVLGHGPLAGRQFWGQDSLPLLAACLRGDAAALALPWDDPAPSVGLQRRRD